MGAVYLAEDPALKRHLAIKIVQVATGQQEVLARFQREAEVSAHLNHPNVITIYDVGEDPAVGPFIAMEFVDGASLADLIRDHRLPTPEERLRILIPAMQAVDAAHASGIVHRDIKPGNLMVGRDGRIKLMDFGVARSGDSGLTVTGSVMGTPSYLAPEQLTGAEPSEITDRYAFAVMAFEVFTGTKPYVGATTATLLYNIAHSPPAFPAAMPAAERAVFERALAKHPDERYPDLASFLQEVISATVGNRSARDRLLAVIEPPKAHETGAGDAAFLDASPSAGSSQAAIADGMKPTTVVVLGASTVAGLIALGYVVWVLGRSTSTVSAPSIAEERPVVAASPAAAEPSLATTIRVTPAIAPLALAPTPATAPTPETNIVPESTASNASTVPTPADEAALASVARSEPVEEPRRRTSTELRNAVRDALRAQGMANVEVRVEPDGRMRLTNLRDEAEATRARTVAGSVSDEPLVIETSLRPVKRPEHRSSPPQMAEHGNTTPHAETEPPMQSAPAWEIHRGGAEQTD
jgi:predicted Ser/Thr protein kinase